MHCLGPKRGDHKGWHDLIAVDNIGDNCNNQLLQLSIFLTANADSQSSRQDQIDQKSVLVEQSRKSDSSHIPSDLVPERPRHPSRAPVCLGPATPLALMWTCAGAGLRAAGDRNRDGRAVVFVII
jgi:hypothetical protein